jgi:hypothetical protein
VDIATENRKIQGIVAAWILYTFNPRVAGSKSAISHAFKGLSHEIDYKYFDKNLQNSA